MEAATAVPDEVTAVAQTANVVKMFRYSAYLHVGDGAEECEHREDGECQDVEHFHAWCRLPNPFQHQDIREKGLAGKARKIRELKEPDSNASVILDQKLDQLGDPAFKAQLIDELLMQDWPVDYLDSVREAETEEKFEHIAQDREELNRLAATERDLPENEQSEDYRRLNAHVQKYVDAINENVKRTQEPKRAEFDSRSHESLVELVRSQRVESDGNAAFQDVYDAWMWFVGTLKVAKHPTLGRPHLPMWQSIGTRDRSEPGTMFGEAPEVIAALKITFNDLQLAQQQGSRGNS